MLRNLTIVAIVGMANSIGTAAVWAQNSPGYTYGVFRENVASLSDDQRNCWTQAMVAGDTINGELLAERLTQQQAEAALQREARRGLCASQRTAPRWTAREQNASNSNWSDSNGSNSGWSNSNGSNSDGSNSDGSSSSASTSDGSSPD
jgi:hypothetical protein